MKIVVSRDDLLTSRFGISPAFELDNLIRALTRRSRTRLGARWLAELQPRFDNLRARLPVEALIALQDMRHSANFIAPPPNGLSQTIEDDLAAMRAAPADVVRAEIDGCLARAERVHPVAEQVLRRPDAQAVVAGLMQSAWEELLEDHWTSLRTALERDVQARAALLAAEGLGGALRDMHPTVSWRDPAIEVAGGQDGVRELHGEGLIFVPSLFLHPGVALYLDPAWRPMLAYPARGAAGVLESPAVPTASGLGRALGRNRAAVLLALDLPMTTTALVALLKLPLGSVGGHLGALKAAGLVQGTREGREVFYERTAVGNALVAAADRI